MKLEEYTVLLHSPAEHDVVIIVTHKSNKVSDKLVASIFREELQIYDCLYVQDKPVDNNVKYVIH